MERVKIETKEKNYEGMLVESPDSKIILIKLDSGYNVGLKKDQIIKIEKISSKNKEKKEKKIEQEKGLKKIAIIATGGTIASKVDYETGGVLAVEKPEDLIEGFPELKKLVQFEVHVPFSIDSSQISSKEWKKLAKLCAELLNRNDIHGIIILHGTDALHYTSAALSFMLHELNKPVVLTFSQRSIDRGSSDAHLNLRCSCYMALSNIAEVMIVGHENENDLSCLAIRGTKARKMHSSKRNAFKAINDLPLTRIFPDGRVEILNNKHKQRHEGKVKVMPFFEDKVALIKFYPGAEPSIIKHLIKEKYKGIIIEALGMGQISVEGENSWLSIIKEAVDAGIFIGITSQTIYGRVDPFIYSPARKLEKAGAVFLEDMLSEAAFIKLSWLLGQELGFEVIKRKMLENISGEVNERLI
jgi:glutamyl-tRNA(Gln) amidotransferase subunit D